MPWDILLKRELNKAWLLFFKNAVTISAIITSADSTSYAKLKLI